MASLTLVANAAPTFCRTQTAESVIFVIDRVQMLGGLGIVVGGAGVGKTTTLTWYADTNDFVGYCTFPHPHTSPADALRHLCKQALGMEIGTIGRASDLYRVVCHWAEQYPCHVLLLDEAQHLEAAAIEVLRGVHDATGIPMVLAGNELFRDQYNRAKNAGFTQIKSRVSVTRVIDRASQEDVIAFAATLGITDPAAVAFLHEQASPADGLRPLPKIVATAREFAGGSAVRKSHLIDAVAVLAREI